MAAETERRGQRYTIEELESMRQQPENAPAKFAETERRGQRYSPDELKYLRDSPLVQKPDGLPEITQWMDPTVDSTASRRPRSGVLRDADTPQIGDGRPERLNMSNPMGHFARRSSTHPEDTVLGPPKLSFTSASRAAKAAAENAEKRTITSLEGDTPLFTGRERWTRDRDTDRNRDKPSYANGRRGGREEGEGWTNVKTRKSLGQDDFDRGFRNGDRDKERQQRDGDEDTVPRRANLGREKVEGRWGRRDDTTKDNEGSRFGGATPGWRERERDRDRDWVRGGTKAEADPEWMDAPVAKEKKIAHTQEDFQRWKEEYGRGKKKETPAVENANPLTETDQPPPAAPITSTSTSKPATPMTNLEGSFELFGVWGKDTATTEAPAPAKAKPKVKASRFASMFAAPEEPAKAAPIAVPSPPVPAPNGDKDEDKEGFQRILQMLGNSNISGATSGPPGISALVNERQGGVSLDFQASQREPEQSPETILSPQPGSRAFTERNLLESFLPPRANEPESRSLQGLPVYRTISPERDDQFRSPRPGSDRPMEDSSFVRPPSRNGSAPDLLGLQAMLNDRRQDTKSSERKFLLALMQNAGTSQNVPRPPPENPNLPPIYDISAQRAASQQQQGRPGQPGFIDDRMLVQNELMRRDAEQREASIREANLRELRELREREVAMQQSELMRKQTQRFAPGFADDPAIIGLQRRATGDLPRQMTNMGIPSQPVPDLPYMRDPRLVQTPGERAIAPPPGFGPAGAMRQPPGFGGPQPPMGPLSAGNTPFGHPAMGPQGMGGVFPNQGRNQMPPPGPPHGYFPPPGFPPMGMGARGDDPRMMMGRPEFDPQFGGPPNQPGMNRPGGRPPNMYNMQ